MATILKQYWRDLHQLSITALAMINSLLEKCLGYLIHKQFRQNSKIHELMKKKKWQGKIQWIWELKQNNQMPIWITSIDDWQFYNWSLCIRATNKWSGRRKRKGKKNKKHLIDTLRSTSEKLLIFYIVFKKIFEQLNLLFLVFTYCFSQYILWLSPDQICKINCSF